MPENEKNKVQEKTSGEQVRLPKDIKWAMEDEATKLTRSGDKAVSIGDVARRAWNAYLSAMYKSGSLARSTEVGTHDDVDLMLVTPEPENPMSTSTLKTVLETKSAVAKLSAKTRKDSDIILTREEAHKAVNAIYDAGIEKVKLAISHNLDVFKATVDLVLGFRGKSGEPGGDAAGGTSETKRTETKPEYQARVEAVKRKPGSLGGSAGELIKRIKRSGRTNPGNREEAG